MAAWTSSSGVEINLEPFTSMGWKFVRLQMSEVLGGKIAEGEVSFVGNGSEESLSLVTGKQMVSYITITMKKEVGPGRKITGFITTRNWTLNSLDIKFLCVPDHKFYTEPLVLNHTGIDEAFENLWPDSETLDIRCKSDLSNGIPLQQLGESSYKFCKKLAYSYKRNSIFCFGLEGFMIKDIIGTDSQGNKEPFIQVTGDGQVNQTSGYHLNYNYRLYKDSEDPYSESPGRKSPRLTALTMDDDYYLVSKTHWGILSNYTHNQNLMESKLFTSFTIVTPDTLPDFKIGDTVLYKRSTETQKNPWDTFFVSKMTYFISTEGEKDENGHGFSVTSILRGIQEDGEVMPTDESRYNK